MVFPGSAKLQLGNSEVSASAAVPSWSLALPGGSRPVQAANLPPKAGAGLGVGCQLRFAGQR
ncbi:hypothetical protein ABIE13_003686 [Ottowia thiooxydans]|uniref:Uncharacterized protein n=1 Tax=Ottowia thiooxydans TaxID=219182 RepID=A0ABV2QC41_9BURK